MELYIKHNQHTFYIGLMSFAGTPVTGLKYCCFHGCYFIPNLWESLGKKILYLAGAEGD